MTTIVAAAGGGNWTAGGTWVGGVAPTASDDAQLTGTSGNVTVNSGAVARSLDATGYTGVLTHSAAVTLTLGTTTAGAGNVALKLVAGMTYTLGNTVTSAITFASSSATQQTVAAAGKTFGTTTFSGANGNYILQDAFVTNDALLVSSGCDLTTNSQAVTAATVTVTGAGSLLALGTSAISLTSTAATNVLLRTNSAVITAGAATVSITTASANTRTIYIGSAALASVTVNYTVAGSTGALALGLVSGNGQSFGALNFSDASNARTLVIQEGVAQTFGTFNVSGTAGKLMSVTSRVPGSTATISKASGTVSSDYLTIQDSTATGGAVWYAGVHSTSVSNNTGWLFGNNGAEAGTSAGTSAAAGTAARTRAVVGASAGTSTAAGSLAAAHAVAAAAAGTSTILAALARSRAVAGLSSGASTATGTPTRSGFARVDVGGSTVSGSLDGTTAADWGSGDGTLGAGWMGSGTFGAPDPIPGERDGSTVAVIVG